MSAENEQDVAEAYEAALAEMAEKALECRELKHAWKVVKRTKGATVSTGATVMTRVDRCTRCKTRRRQWYTWPDMVIVDTEYYNYPEGYRVHGLGRISTYDVRAEAFSRAAVEPESDDLAARRDAKRIESKIEAMVEDVRSGRRKAR